MSQLYQPYYQPQWTNSSITTNVTPYYTTWVSAPTVSAPAAVAPLTPAAEGPLDWLDRRVSEVCDW